MKSKIGLHMNGMWGGEDEWMERARPQVVVSLDHNRDKWNDLRSRSPNTFIIGRYVAYDDGDPRYYPTGDGDTPEGARGKAEAYFNANRPDIEKMRGVYDAWVGINEPICKNEQHAENLSAWHERWGDLMKEANVTSIAYTFSQGVPEREHWKILAKGLKHCDLLGLHEYWCPRLRSEDMIPWHVLRYRTAWQELPDDAKRQIVITECGVDGGAANIDTAGWKKFVIEGIFLEDLQAYDAEMQKDDYVIGATIFCAGGGWDSWDVTNARSIPAWIGDTGDAVRAKVQRPKISPTKPVEPKPTKPAPELLRLAEVREYVQDAIAKLGSGDGDGARNILVTVVTPWFYATATQSAAVLENAQAHTTARWHCEEATRRIEANKLSEARDVLRDIVLAWLKSSGPASIGVLSLEAAVEPKVAKKKTTAKKAPKKKVTAKKAAAKTAAAKKASAKKPKSMVLSAGEAKKAKAAKGKKKTAKKGN